MSELRQRQPRVKDERFLNFIRAQPCCLCSGIDTEAAHIRAGSMIWNKRETGMAEKPDDRWTVPLCNHHHREQHARGDELAFWGERGIDPFALSLSYQCQPYKERP